MMGRREAADKTGIHLTVLGVLLLMLLAAVTILMAVTFSNGVDQLAAASDHGIVLAGALFGYGVAVAGVFKAAARMLQTIPDIHAAKSCGHQH